MIGGPDNEIVRPGEVLLGKYRVERVIGGGGMGVVLEAFHLQFEERVAIKFLLPALARHEEAVGRFEREARVMFKLRSEHICRVLDVGHHGGVPYMVMEHLDGQDLGTMLGRRQPLPLDRVFDYALQACEGLACAHAHGIVHRDLKPENLFIVRGPGGDVLKVLDFGLSKVRSEEGQRARKLTAREQVMGTPNYMAPEQWVASAAVNAAADQWALGAIVFEMLTGRPPFEGDQLANVCGAILNAPTPSAHALRKEAPAGVDVVLHKALEKQPSARYRHVGALAQALAAFGPPTHQARAERALRLMEQAAPPEQPELAAPSPRHASSDMATTLKRLPEGAGALVAAPAGAVQPGATLPMTHPSTPRPATPRPWDATRGGASWHEMLRDRRRSRRLASVAVITVIVAGAAAVVAVASTRADTAAVPSPPSTPVNVAPPTSDPPPREAAPVAVAPVPIASATGPKRPAAAAKPRATVAAPPPPRKPEPPPLFEDR